MTSFIPLDEYDGDVLMENYIREYDKTVMPTPGIEFEPYIILNKVRKHYMEYIIKLLSANYERNLRIPSKSLYRLPSAIWRCAKSIEMSAAQTSIVLQLYRRNILAVVEELKNDTMAGKLNKKLYNCLYKPPSNEKRTQTTQSNLTDCNCQCICNQRKKIRTSESLSIESSGREQNLTLRNSIASINYTNEQHIPDQETSQVDSDLSSRIPNFSNASETVTSSQTSDELVQQLEKLFEGDGNDDDIFESVLRDELQDEGSINCSNGLQVESEKGGTIIEAHSAQIKSLDERLVTLASLIVNTEKTAPDKIETPVQKVKKMYTSKWLCEEYFLKMKLLDLLDHIRDTNRLRLRGINQLFVELFGEHEEEDLMSPMEETPEFVLSCKERIAPWIVKMLTPYYIKGRIKGKVLFKALSKHLIKLIYQCSQYPEQYEVHSFVSDFLKTHKVIRCEADFKEFRIMNI